MATEIVTVSASLSSLKKRVDIEYVNRLEQIIKKLERKCKLEERSFYIPGENFPASILDVARAVARRVERKVVTLKRKHLLRNDNILIYF